MLIVRLKGGLGNQCFQYAYAKSLENRGYSVKIDISEFTLSQHREYELGRYSISLENSTKEENDRYIKLDLLSKILRKAGLDKSKVVRETSSSFDVKLLNVEDENYIIGYFQSEKYFQNIRSTLLQEFRPNEITNYTKMMEREILSSEKSISIHIRRGDYLRSVNMNVHGICSLEYYSKALKYIEEKVGRTTCFFFSDDIGWVKKNFRGENYRYVEEENRSPHEDIHLMSLCSHNIIANSSFSWWGAWINQNDSKIVIAPERWFADEYKQKQEKDRIPKRWIKI